MCSQLRTRSLIVALCLTAAPALCQAQVAHDSSPAESIAAATDDLHAIPPQFDVSGPRIGATFSKDGEVRSQFGWHFEHQIESSRRGPWLVVETVLLAGGLEQRKFIPNGTMVFGMRLANGFEFGVGPNVTIVPQRGILRSSVVAALGRTFRINGIQLPVNLAYAFDKDGERLTVVTGWAVRHADDWNHD